MVRRHPKTVSYNRFVELKRDVTLPLLVFVKQVPLSESGYFIGA